MATVVNPPYISQQILDDNGKPLSSGKLKFFRNNTDIPNPVYTSDGSTSLGPEITLDSSGFPETQYALVQDREYTVKAFDSDGVLIWTRNNIVGCGTTGSGPTGDYVPMTGTSIGDPIVGSLVLQDTPGAVLDTRNTVSKTGSTLVDTFGGQTVFNRNGLDVQMVNTRGEFLYNKARIQNTQNGFPGYPNYAELGLTSLTMTEEVSDSYGSRVEKQLKLSVATNDWASNKIESNGTLNIQTSPGGNIHLNGDIVDFTAASSIQFIPTGGGKKVIVSNGGTLITQKLAIGTSVENTEVIDIWTSDRTGVPRDDQLITAKAALAGGGSGGTVCIESTTPQRCTTGTLSTPYAFGMLLPDGFTPKSATVYTDSAPTGSTFYVKIYSLDTSTNTCQIVYSSDTGSQVQYNTSTAALNHVSTYHPSQTLEGGRYVIVVSSSGGGFLIDWDLPASGGILGGATVNNPGDTFTFISSTPTYRIPYVMIKGTVS